jgi:hypothetical protein
MAVLKIKFSGHSLPELLVVTAMRFFYLNDLAELTGFSNNDLCGRKNMQENTFFHKSDKMVVITSRQDSGEAFFQNFPC